MSNDPCGDAIDRCSQFLEAMASLCAEHRVVIRVEESLPLESVEFIEHSDDPTGFGFISNVVDVADAVQRRFDAIHSSDAALHVTPLQSESA